MAKVYNAGNAYLQILPSMRGVERLMQRETKKLAREIDKAMASATHDGLLKAFGDIDPAKVARSAAASGQRWAAAFEREIQARIKPAVERLPTFEPDADLSKLDRAIKESRDRLIELSNARIGPRGDVGLDQLNSELGKLIERMRALADESDDFDKAISLDVAAGHLRDLRQHVERTRQEMEQLTDRQVSVDVELDAADALARLEVFEQRLDRLDGRTVTVNLRVDDGGAGVNMRRFTEETDRGGQAMQDFGRDAGITMSRLGYLIAIGASLGSLIAPAAATAAVAIAGIGAAAAGAVAGFGVLALGLAGIGDAVQKIDAYQQDADKSAQAFVQAQNRVLSATEAVRDAERGLANARRDAADGAVQAQQRIADARRNAERAQRDAAEAVARARRNEREAIEDVARARVDAHEMVERAVEAQEDAERGLEKAVKDQKEARQELNEAIRDAVRDLRELDTAVKRNALEIEEATTASMKAKEELDKLLTNPRATEIEKRMALEAYQDKIIQIEELQNRQEELRQQQADAAKEGVESTDRVKRAREQVANADERAADAARRLEDARTAADRARVDAAEKIEKAEQRVADAHAATAKAQRDGAERVADAQRSVADAQRAAARQQQQAQQQILSATEAVTRAQRNLAQASVAAGTAGGEAFDNMNDALNELSPAGQDFAKWLYSLKPLLAELRASAQEGLLPGLQDSMQLLIATYFPAFNRFVEKIASGLGNMFRATAVILTNPQWRAFFAFIDNTALPALEGAWVASLNLARGVANLIRALSPLSAPIGQGLVDLTERFAKWSDQLQTDTGFQQFMDYAQRVGPKVVHLVEQLVEFFGRLVIAAAPVGEFLVDTITNVVEWFNAWDLDTLSAAIELVAILGTGIWVLTGFVRGVRFAMEVWNSVTAIATRAYDLLAGAAARYQAASAGAITNAGLLNGEMFRADRSGRLGAAGMQAMSSAAGPLGAALVILGAAWFVLQQSQSKAEEATDELTDGLVELGKAYKEAAEASRIGTAAVVDSLKKVVSQNEDLQRAVIVLDDLGVGLETIGAAATGSADELDRVLQVIDSRIKVLQGRVAGAAAGRGAAGFDVGKTEEELRLLEEMRGKFGEAAAKAHLASDAMRVLNASTTDLANSTAYLTPQEKALAEAQKILGDEAATTEDKLNALKTAQDTVRQTAIDAIEAEEQWEASLDSLTSSVKAAKDADDKHATSLSAKTSTGRANRDMLQQLIASADRMYDADVALNGVTQEAIDKGQGHYQQIRDVAKQLGLSKKETDKLIGAYGKIPTDIETAIGFKEGQFEKMFEQLEMAAYIQKALKAGTDVDKAKRQYREIVESRNRAKAHGWAVGGPIDGPGIVGGPTEDANLIWASRGEFMQPTSTVRYYGAGVMEAIRRKLIPREMFQGLAAGGTVGGKQKWPFDVDLAKIWVPSTEDIMGSLFGSGVAGVLGNIIGGRGFKWQMSALRKVFPGLALISGFRPGSRTLSGNLSWHARGRAVDVPPIRKVAEWIYRTFGKTTLELITPWRDLMLYKGKPHKYSPAIERQHGVGSAGNDHIHWAYDQGGMLPPGYTHAWNGTGRPEAVLTDQQWRMIAQLARGGDQPAGGNTYHFEFRDSTLDAARLRAIQDREAVLARTGRAR